MGVPGFFAWLLKQDLKKSIVLKNITKQPKGLYLDSNCLFHPQCFKLLSYYHNETNITKLEDMMIKRIINYINYLINYVNPSEVIFIAVDGVAPVAKINQQRKRRYKSVIDNDIKFNLQRKYKIPHNESWSNIVITPGTNFMIKLDKALNKLKQINKKIIYSSYKEPGEGEHKILQYIKNNVDKTTEDINVIYGLDADLIFLTFASEVNNLYLLRELQHLDKKFKENDSKDKHPVTDVNEYLCYVSIDNTIQTLNEYITNKLVMNKEFTDIKNLNNFRNDFIFICYFLGNDFIPHIPSIDIKKGGMDLVIDAYVHAIERTGEYLIQDKTNLIINPVTFKLFLSFLVEEETKFFKITLPKYYSKQKYCNLTNDYEIDLWELDNMIDIDRFIKINKRDLELDPFYLTSPQIELDNSKSKYYSRYFNVNFNQEHQVSKIVDSFYKILYWTMDYYFNLCNCWITHYEFNHAPFISDIYKYIDKINNYKFDKNPPISINQQLISVIPPQYKNVVPKNIIKYYDDTNLKHMLPYKFKLDCHYKDMFWLVNAELPYLDIDIIKNNVKE
jgi:5'-3' exonuclease